MSVSLKTIALVAAAVAVTSASVGRLQKQSEITRGLVDVSAAATTSHTSAATSAQPNPPSTADC